MRKKEMMAVFGDNNEMARYLMDFMALYAKSDDLTSLVKLFMMIRLDAPVCATENTRRSRGIFRALFVF